MQATTIGLDLAKHWFQVHGWLRAAPLPSAGSCDAARF
jgi:hypothetical protein